MSNDREQRNAVFSAAGVDPRIPTMSAFDKVKSDFGLDIPVELVPLPSDGRVYPDGSPLANRETIEIRSMTAREEDILTSRALVKKGTVISELIKSCLVDKSINVQDMLVGDRNALMVAIRITGYGADYEAELDCPTCETKTLHVFNLAELALKRLEIDPVAAGTNVFQTTLPVSKKVVQFKFLTGRDEDDMSAMADKQKKLGLGAESNVTTNLLYSIVAVDGVTDRAKIAGFVKMMPARDSLHLRTFIRENEPGIILRNQAMCQTCSEFSEEVDMPLGVNFFWPSARK